MNLIIKDAFRQILWRIASAIWGFLVIKMLTPYLGTLRMWDYGTIVNYFAMFWALADFWLYVVAMRELGKLKKKHENNINHPEVELYYHKFFSSRVFTICCVYAIALIIAYMIPAYTANPYITVGLPLGMIFSASFMLSGILQVPLQLSRSMKQLSISLVFARFMQLGIIALTVYVRHTGAIFPSDTPNIAPFLLVMWSVVASGLTQLIYVYIIGNKKMKLKRVWDRDFTLHQIKNNRQYGTAYFLSSMHTLIVFQLLGILFPTVQDFDFAGEYYVALTLLTIMLIVPSAIWNSLMQDMGETDIDTKKKRYGSLMLLVLVLGIVVSANFIVFARDIILFIGNADYLWVDGSFGADTVLMFMWVVLTLSFIKQVYNYFFVTQHLHNNLLKINLFWVVWWLLIWRPLMIVYKLPGAVATQILLELLFVIGTLYIWRRNKSLIPISVSSSLIVRMICVVAVVLWWLYMFPKINSLYPHRYIWIAQALVMNLIIWWLLLTPMKKVMKGL